MWTQWGEWPNWPGWPGHWTPVAHKWTSDSGSLGAICTGLWTAAASSEWQRSSEQLQYKTSLFILDTVPCKCLTGGGWQFATLELKKGKGVNLSSKDLQMKKCNINHLSTIDKNRTEVEHVHHGWTLAQACFERNENSDFAGCLSDPINTDDAIVLIELIKVGWWRAHRKHLPLDDTGWAKGSHWEKGRVGGKLD